VHCSGGSEELSKECWAGQRGETRPIHDSGCYVIWTVANLTEEGVTGERRVNVSTNNGEHVIGEYHSALGEKADSK
jgi:hypothetical protein